MSNFDVPMHKAKFDTAILALREREYDEVQIKKLRGPIHELKLKKHRFIFFELESCIYFTNAFMKKTMKTPKLEIEYALAVYTKISNRL